MMNESFKYYAFISYSHRDKKIAKKLQRRLEHYHLPAAVRKSNPDLPKKLSPIFMDDSDLVGVGTLKTALQANLDRSNYIILICSPSSAKSEYVNDEIEYFISQGRADHIIPLIVEGVPHSGDPSTECFPPALLGLERENELLGIDLTKFGEHDAFIRVIATLLQLDIDDFVARDAKERKRKAGIFVLICAALVALAVILMPPPYDKTYADNVMTGSVMAYAEAGKQYEALNYLTDCAVNNPENFSRQLQLYRERAFFAEVKVLKNSMQNLAEMMKTGKVMPWSRKPMSQAECEELLTLADTRAEEYRYFASVLVFVMDDEFANRHYGKEYPALLNELLEIDADIAAELYQVVCTPHLTGKYADDSTTAKQLASLFSGVPRQNEHLTGEDVKQARESLARLKGARTECLRKLNACGAFEAYSSVMGEPKPAVISGDVRTEQQQESIDQHPESIDRHPESEDKSEVRVLNDLLGYIYHSEMMYTDMLYVLDAFERFDSVKDWETLLIARAALSSARNDIVRRKLPVQEMTPEDEQAFMKRGIDISFLGTLGEQFKGSQTGLTTTCKLFTANIMFDVLLKYDWDICMRSVVIERKMINVYLQSLANMADWVLASINNPKTTEKFNALLEEHCPETHARQRKQPDTPENIEASAHELMNQLESLMLENSKSLGAANNRFNLTKDATEKNDMEFIRNETAKIAHIPLAVPQPAWLKYSDMYAVYFWNDNGGVQSIPPRTKLERVPDGVRITMYGVRLDEVKAYQQELEQFSKTAATQLGRMRVWGKDEGKKYTVFCKTESSYFAVIWENAQARILMLENLACFVPKMYLPAVVDMIKAEREDAP